MIHHASKVPAYIPGREPEHAKALSLKDPIAHGVVLRLQLRVVMRAVHLDDEPVGETGKVEEVAAEWKLPAEREAALAQSL